MSSIRFDSFRVASLATRSSSWSRFTLSSSAADEGWQFVLHDSRLPPDCAPCDAAVKIVRKNGPLSLYRGFFPIWGRFAPQATLQLVTLAENLGAVESLVTHPATMTHGTVPAEQRHAAGISDGLIRLSVGLEEPRDIIADLEKALAECAGGVLA